jgi:hypothetical protein
LYFKAKPVDCSKGRHVCENGGVCKNITVHADSFFGFECVCPKGYSGEICEKSKP